MIRTRQEDLHRHQPEATANLMPEMVTHMHHDEALRLHLEDMVTEGVTGHTMNDDIGE